MKRNFPRAPKDMFDKFSSYFAYCTVDVAIHDECSILLAKRTIPPYRSKWNLPGGVVFKTEKLSDAARRIAREELGLVIRVEEFLGVYENPVQPRHDISHVFLASVLKGRIKPDFQSSRVRFFRRPPSDMVPYQKKMVRDASAAMRKKSVYG